MFFSLARAVCCVFLVCIKLLNLFGHLDRRFPVWEKEMSAVFLCSFILLALEPPPLRLGVQSVGLFFFVHDHLRHWVSATKRPSAYQVPSISESTYVGTTTFELFRGMTDLVPVEHFLERVVGLWIA